MPSSDLPQSALDISPVMADGQGTERRDQQLEHRRLWDKYMDNHLQWIQYKKIVVMMISWEDTDMDQDMLNGEIRDLREVLETDYDCEVHSIRLHSDDRPAKYLNKRLSELVYDHDTKDSLVIVYYAGHGWSPIVVKEDRVKGHHFNLTAKAQAAVNKLNSQSHVAWHTAERNLSTAEGDVLGIFDCCEAGRILEMGRGTRRFEYLGACGRSDQTPAAGPHSFTRALIWALKNFARSGKTYFTVADLRDKIVEAPNFPPDQSPYIGSRNPNPDLITLTPARIASSSKGKSAAADKASTRHPRGAMLNLQFQFDSPMTNEILEHTANALKAMISRDELSVKRISYLENYAVGRWWDTVRKVMSTGLLKQHVPNHTDGTITPMPEGTAVTASPTDITSPRQSFPAMAEPPVEENLKRKATEELRSADRPELQDTAAGKRRRSSRSEEATAALVLTPRSP